MTDPRGPYRSWDGGNVLRLFWRRRPHGYRQGRWYRCARCGGFEFAAYHPRGYWTERPTLIELLP